MANQSDETWEVNLDDIQIFKVQLSITTGHKKRQVLVYNEDRSVMGQFDDDGATDKILDGAIKGYIYAIVRDGELDFIGLAPEQEW